MPGSFSPATAESFESVEDEIEAERSAVDKVAGVGHHQTGDAYMLLPEDRIAVGELVGSGPPIESNSPTSSVAGEGRADRD
jgi:hypothetical protein